MRFGAPPSFPAANDAGHDHEPGTYTSHPIPHSVGLVVSLNRRSKRAPGGRKKYLRNVYDAILLTLVCHAQPLP